MTTTLITGGNKGLGFEAAKRLIALGHTVYIGARDRTRGEASAKQLGARFVQLDVTDDASVAAAAAALPALDVLVNNAGIAGAHTAVGETTADQMRDVFDTNVFGIVRVTRAMLPLLQKSANPVIVNVASGLGSVAVVNDPKRIESSVKALAYTSSKSAVVMLTIQYAKAFPKLRINVVDPGYTATDLNGHSGPQTVQEGTDAIVAMATIDGNGPTGAFKDRHGNVPW